MPKQPSQVEAQAMSRTAGGDVHSALLSYSQMLHQDLSRNRFAEEREWYETALFYQRRQWLKWDNSNRRWSLVKQDPTKPRPMPVTNHFARTVNATANQLSSGRVKVYAVPTDDSNTNRRAAEFGETAIRAIDRETNFELLVPLLGKHATLWGIGVTKDYYDTSLANGTVRVPQIELKNSQTLGCLDCGETTDLSAVMMANAGATQPGQQEAPCPGCGSMNTVSWDGIEPVVTEVKEFSKGKLCTQVVPIFEVFVPRNCQNPNLARKLQHRYRLPLGEAKRLWGDAADDLKADTKLEIHEIYLEALRSLVNYNYMHDQTAESVTITETWAKFDQLPEELQETLREAVLSQDKGDDDEGDEPAQSGAESSGTSADAGPVASASGADGAASAGDNRSLDAGGEAAGDDGEENDLFEAPDGELDPIQQLEQWGIFLIEGGGKVLDWGISPLEDDTPFTFYLWELDPANVYPKGLGVDLVPLQKRLNRLDSLIELAFMSNAAGKWLWPTTQTTKPPTGSPSDVVEYDPIGDGKIAPSFVLPTPIHASAWTLRAAILMDFQQIGMTQGVQQGMNPQGVTAFRGLAYLGAKADEQISTQRFLWETAHALRYRKALCLARKNWTEERKVKVAGFNGRWGMKQLFGRDLEGEYILEIQPNSSRPKTLAEKEQAFQLLLEGGMIDPTDSQTREYVISQLANLDDVNLTNHLQYLKAERDLDTVLEGQMPIPNPNVDVQIQLKIFIDFTLTEEFEGIAPQAQQMIMLYVQQLQAAQQAMMAAQVAQIAQAAAPPIAASLAGAMRNKQGKGKGMNGVPGVDMTAEGAGQGATAEAANVAAQVP